MPYKIRKNKGSYSVTSPHGTRAKHTTKEKAEAQVRLLQAVEHNPGFKPKHHSCEDGDFLTKRRSL